MVSLVENLVDSLMSPFWEPIVNNPLLFELRETYYTNYFILHM